MMMNMGGSSDAAGQQQVAMISPQFCVNEPIELTLVRKRLRSFTVTDLNDNIVFTVKCKHFSLRELRVLYDLSGNPIITFHPKFPSLHERWVVFRGESTDSKDLLFSVKSRKYVFLATNTEEKLCDFRIESSWFNRSCVIYAGDSSNIVAKMQSAHLFGGTFSVTVYSNVDYAFIVALVVILVNPTSSAPSVSS